ncbi:hypothetical protein ABT160_27860 [Streptomyces sp. NPDC001941]|uniref:hypothetical protein n=1 Tax=Streptomyces sp. NPDC001941 TaxID=3154659 RepID=UPI00332F8786
MRIQAPRHPRVQQVTATGAALAGALLPLVVGVLLARSVAVDPYSPVNALITNGTHRPRLSPAEWRRQGRRAVRRCRHLRAGLPGRDGTPRG